MSLRNEHAVIGLIAGDVRLESRPVAALEVVLCIRT